MFFGNSNSPLQQPPQPTQTPPKPLTPKPPQGKTEKAPKLILFNNFDYENFDNSASFDIFDYTNQNAIIFYEGKYILAKVYFQYRDPFFDDDVNSPGFLNMI